LEQKALLVRARTIGVVERYSNGLYLWGDGGTSKSYTVEETLKQHGKPYKLSNSRVTGKGLFELLQQYPDVVHVLEDVETLLLDKNAHGVLRSALWGQKGKNGWQERTVVWHIGGNRQEFIFEGGIIMIANLPLYNLPPLRAVGTRIPVLHFQPTNEEIAALMRKIAREGHTHGPYRLEAQECLEVAEAIVTRSIRLQRNLDIRLLINTFNDRLQYVNGDCECHWLDLLDSRMRERTLPMPPGPRGVREETRERELALVGRIANLPHPERLEIWRRETGKSQAAFYRRLGEQGDSQDSQLAG
jgi:hypothetical protein